MGSASVLHWHTLFAWFFFLYKIDSSQNVLISKKFHWEETAGEGKKISTYLGTE